MAEHNDFGKMAEEKAKAYFLAQNYQILAQNYRYLKAEVDLIVRKNQLISIVEVRARHENFVLSPLESISKNKIRLLIMAANHFVENFTESVEISFDVMSVILAQNDWQLEHIPNAFDAMDANGI